jgi:hypothetical protein
VLAKYKIIGGDKKEYGTATADEVRQWIAEGRLNAQSQVQAEGSGEWKALGAFAEFADALRAQAAPPPVRAVPAPPASPELWTSQILARRPEVQPGRCLAQSWKLLAGNFGTLFGATFLIWVIGTACELNAFTGLLYNVMWGVFYGGLYLVFLKKIRGEHVSAGDAFAGFSLGFGQLLLTGFLSSLLSRIGFCFCVVPWIYLFVAWTFSVPLVADKRLEFWSAMELSRKVVSRVWFEMLWLLILAFLPFIVAYVVVDARVTYVHYPEMRDLVNSAQPDIAHIGQAIHQVSLLAQQATKDPVWTLPKVVLLLNLPFALGALMYAYENIFGTRNAPAA